MTCHDLAWRYIAALDIPLHDISSHCYPLQSLTSHILHICFTYISQTLHRQFTHASHTLHIHFPYTSHTLHMHCKYMSNIPSQNFTFHCCTLHYITLTSPDFTRMGRSKGEQEKKAQLCTFMLPEVTNTYSSPFSPICMQG